jgi:hypothetical protein
MGSLRKRRECEVLERKLADIVEALREHCPDGNITLRVIHTGDLVAVLRLPDDEAQALAEMLGSKLREIVAP